MKHGNMSRSWDLEGHKFTKYLGNHLLAVRSFLFPVSFIFAVVKEQNYIIRQTN